MEAGTLAEALQQEHREIDGAVEAFLAEPDGRCDSLTQAITALRRHIFLEEEFLFPPLRDAGFVAPIFVMLREHGELWQTMESIEQELAAGDATVAARCKWLLALLDKHNAKEEPILYPHADGVLGAPASADLKRFLADGRMPDGWVCTGARAGGSAAAVGHLEVARPLADPDDVLVDEWGRASFPASDPPTRWAGRDSSRLRT